MVNYFKCVSKLTTACVTISLVKKVGNVKYIYFYARKFRGYSAQSK